MHVCLYACMHVRMQAGGQLPCLEVSTSITGYGRQMIHDTKQMVEDVCTVANGYEADAKVIYGDTDSVMVDFRLAPGDDLINRTMELGQQMAERVSQRFVSPIRLEFEKVYCPYLLMNKKRYAGLIYTRPETYDRVDCKGIETVRRDFCPLVQKVVDTILKKILMEKDVQGAKEYTKHVVSDLLQNKIDMSLLVVSKSIGKEDYAMRMCHTVLADKLRQRDPATAPHIGERVSYVIVKGTKGERQFERAEDPLYVLEHNLPIDTNHYLESMKNPVIRIFEGVMTNPETLLTGAHTNTVVMASASSGALAKFVKKTNRCLSCKTPLKESRDDHDGFCNDCGDDKKAEIVFTRTSTLKDSEKLYNKLWTQCQRCQGSFHQDVICTSRDCPIFYKRTKVKKDLEALQEQMKRLQTTW
eukprot:GHVU01060413.1.p1 GENE.GHVU01060413.1~~GHVU01060413.1.p1  ORF type:complete len:414 (-),score=85.75 GHVU01060413.1:592-1833(-)